LIDKHPDVVRRFLAATAKAIAYMHGHKEWSIAFLKRYFNDNDDQAVRMAYTNFILKINPDGAMQPSWMKDSLGLGAIAGVTGATSINDVFATGFTPIRP
jgi:ABC-type nitrate/sulfonate/bicarbonate transport system substrate-binding protein